METICIASGAFCFLMVFPWLSALISETLDDHKYSYFPAQEED